MLYKAIQYISLPGQAASLHVSVCDSSVEQAVPPSADCVNIRRVLVIEPPPHVTGQSDQAVHSPISQSIGAIQ